MASISDSKRVSSTPEDEEVKRAFPPGKVHRSKRSKGTTKPCVRQSRCLFTKSFAYSLPQDKKISYILLEVLKLIPVISLVVEGKHLHQAVKDYQLYYNHRYGVNLYSFKLSALELLKCNVNTIGLGILILPVRLVATYMKMDDQKHNRLCNNLHGKVQKLLNIPQILSPGLVRMESPLSFNKKISIQIEISDRYEKWRAKAIADKVYPIFRSFLDVEKKFDNFICPLKQDICSIPLLAPDGQTYNYEEINTYISNITDEDDVKVKSPVGGRSFSRNDLLLNVQYCKDLIIKAEEVYKEVGEIGNNEIKYGVQAVIDNTKKIMRNVRKKTLSKLWDECDAKIEAGKMTDGEAVAYIRKELVQWKF